MSFDIVAVFGNKVERCFDIVAGVDGALGNLITFHLAVQVEHLVGCVCLSVCLFVCPDDIFRRKWPFHL